MHKGQWIMQRDGDRFGSHFLHKLSEHEKGPIGEWSHSTYVNAVADAIYETP